MSRLFLLLLAGLKFGKLFGTLATMLIAIGVYAIAFGWRYAVGIVAMLFLHEMGHYLAARQRGLKVRLPMFVPFVVAWTTLEETPHDAETDASIALAGSYTGFFINLINMIPLPPLDGGKITAVLSPRIWLLGVPVIGALMWFHFSVILLLVAILAFPHVVTALKFDKNDPAHRQYFAVSPRVRWEYGLLYVGLIAFLAYMTTEVDGQLHGIHRHDTEQAGSGTV
jgi:Zn-dependent protease